jgi:hypothetical protein
MTPRALHVSATTAKQFSPTEGLQKTNFFLDIGLTLIHIQNMVQVPNMIHEEK